MLRLLRAAKDRWRLRRDPAAFFRSRGATVGERCRFIDPRPGTIGSEPWLVELGDHITLSAGVDLITHDGGVWVFRDQHPDIDLFGRIVIEDNVFVGAYATVLPGVRIGRDSIVAARAVVTRDVPPGTIVGGVPARPISTIASYWERNADRFTFGVRSLDPATRRVRVLEELSRRPPTGSAPVD